VKVTLYDYIRLLNYLHISICRWSAADLSTTINFNIIQTRRVIRVESRVESWVITSESELYSGWDLSRVASHQNVTQVASRKPTALVNTPVIAIHLSMYLWYWFVILQVTWERTARCLAHCYTWVTKHQLWLHFQWHRYDNRYRVIMTSVAIIQQQLVIEVGNFMKVSLKLLMKVSYFHACK